MSHHTATPTTPSSQHVDEPQDHAEPFDEDAAVVQGGDLCQNFSNPSEELPALTSDAANPSAAVSFANVATIYDYFDEEYSPSRPGYVFSGDWEEFCNVELYTEAVPTIKTSFSQDHLSFLDPQDTLPFPDPVSPLLVPQPYDPLQDFLADQQFIDWYLQSLQSGAFDAFTFGGDALPGSFVAPRDVPLPGKLSLHDGSDDADLAPSIIPGIGAVPQPVPADVYRPFAIDSTDLDHVPTLIHSADDSGSDTSSSDELYLEPGSVLRHYWSKDDLKYSVVADGRKYFLTAEQLDEAFGNVNFSLWHYWKGKRPGRTSHARIIAHFRRMGHHGFFREMMWHLAPRWLQKMLYACRKAGTLESFVIPDEAPKKPKRK